ncbi:DUF1036 domain-containing protein [Bartonella bovis]|uniref:Uncharacterized protein n=1 Tax=Bartonella bovis 91-4 TaxID=1094491 RepID=N6V8W5_9HYPH|nr:DUF1036 domain-containing protein [Bartonella bovis]ENN90300.1 hypothetical protein BBbe_12180 [Bartonella bovis 91-4]
MFYCRDRFCKIGLENVKKHEGLFQQTRQKKLKVFLLNVLILFLCTEYVRADFRVCNMTQKTVGIALGYRIPSDWMSEGWWVVPPTMCKTLIDGPLSSRFYYLYAEDAQKKGSWVGSVTMCVKDSKFVIEGVHDCFARGFQKATFEEIDTGDQTSWMVQLIDRPFLNNSVSKSPNTSEASP